MGETDTYSPVFTDHSTSPKHSKMLSIDTVTLLHPIKDSTISEDEVIAKEENMNKNTTKKRKKLKPAKTIKPSNGFTKLLSLYASKHMISEKQMKQDCHQQISELLSCNIKNSKEITTIRNFEVMADRRLCEMTINIFCDSDRAEMVDDYLCFDVWNIGLLMLLMLIGKERVIHYEQRLNNLDNIRLFLTDLYLQHKISTNCFDLLYFFMLIFDYKENEKIKTRYDQIAQHRWFHT